MSKIVLVEDDLPLAEMVQEFLKIEGYEVFWAEDGEEGERLVLEHQPDLIVLDMMLPGIDGFEVCRRLRPDYTGIIIMLTARDEELTEVTALKLGVDDYITKPFSPKELVARVKAVLRRTQPTATDDPIELIGLRLEPMSHRVTLEGSDLHLGPMEFKLLHFFMTHQERVYSRDQLLDNVWGTNTYVEDRTVDVHIRRLRKALITHDKLIQTVRGSGYRFSTRVD